MDFSTASLCEPVAVACHADAKLKVIIEACLITDEEKKQACICAVKAGADFVAPYVNRLDNIIADGCEVVAQIVEQFAIYDLPCKVLAASFKNAEQVHKCASAGCQCVTVTADVLKFAISHPMTDAAINGFEKDWKNVYGDKTILDF